jgi:hypothetical protein
MKTIQKPNDNHCSGHKKNTHTNYQLQMKRCGKESVAEEYELIYQKREKKNAKEIREIIFFS